MLKQSGRRLVASPWFAAGAGFVIATSAIIYAPHNNVDFGGAIQVTHCKQALCGRATQAQAPGLPAGSGAHMPAAAPTLPRSITFWYQPVGHSTGSEFAMWIEIHARDSLGQWQLSFVIPGAKDIYVYWPRSHVSGTHVVVSSYYAGTESAGYAQISAHESGGADGPSRGGYTVLFQLRGTGTASTPVHCTYKGAACTFRLSETLAQADSPFSR